MRFAISAILVATPTFAGPITSSTCEGLALFLKARVPDIRLSGAPRLSAEGCTLRDVTLETNPMMSVKIGSLSIGGANFGLDDPGWVTFDALQLTLGDVRFVPKSSAPAFDWAIELQDARAGIDVTLVLTPMGDKGWRLSKGMIDFPGDNAISLTFSVPDADISSRNAASFSMAALRVTEAELKLTTHGLFETFALIPIMSTVPADSTDPKADFNTLRDQIMTWVGQVSPDALDEKAKDALNAFLLDLPTPDGDLTVSFADEPGFGAENLLPVLMATVPEPVEIADTLLRGLDLSVTWKPSH